MLDLVRQVLKIEKIVPHEVIAFDSRPFMVLLECHLHSYDLYSYGLYSYGLYSYGLYSDALYNYGLYSYGLHSYGL